MAALTAAYELSDPKLNGKYDITLYQLGWRLGGKCASGRDLDRGCRVQEHGPHIFFGFYDNAFDVLRGCYQALDRKPGEGFQTLEQALEPRSKFFLMEKVGDDWKPWELDFPDMPGQPGSDIYPSDWQILLRVLEWLAKKVRENAARLILPDLDEIKERAIDAVDSLIDRLTGDDEDEKVKKGEDPDAAMVIGLAREAWRFGQSLDVDGKDHRPQDYESLAETLREMRSWFWDKWQDDFSLEDELRRLYILVDLATTVSIGALLDGLLFPTAEAVAEANKKDYRAWLDGWGAAEITRNSAVVRGMYDTVFAYPNGDMSQAGNVEAGNSVRAQMAMIGYRGPIYWKMRAGTGDITAAPLYQLLVERKVKFRFFHRVDELILSDDGKEIASVRIGRQVTLKNGDYQPLVPCKQLPCWPSDPLYKQIVEGQELEARKIDLESYWTDWQDTGGELVLEKGTSFDHLVLGISIASLAQICQKLSASNKAWAEMIQGVATVQTQNVQAWFNQTLKQMGWTESDQPVVTGYDAGPLDTWLDASEVLPQECWGDRPVHQMSLLCGPLETPPSMPPRGRVDYPSQVKSQVHAHALSFLQGQAKYIWPAIWNGGDVDWKALVAPDDLSGPARLDWQYIRPNINPSDRYVLSLVGTSGFRLRPNDSGFANLVLAGDWTDNGMNLGSFEAAIMSGRLASRAVSGFPEKIFGLPSYYPDD